MVGCGVDGVGRVECVSVSAGGAPAAADRLQRKHCVLLCAYCSPDSNSLLSLSLNHAGTPTPAPLSPNATHCFGLFECCARPHVLPVLVAALEGAHAVAEGHIGLEEVGVVAQASNVTGLEDGDGERERVRGEGGGVWVR